MEGREWKYSLSDETANTVRKSSLMEALRCLSSAESQRNIQPCALINEADIPSKRLNSSSNQVAPRTLISIWPRHNWLEVTRCRPFVAYHFFIQRGRGQSIKKDHALKIDVSLILVYTRSRSISEKPGSFSSAILENKLRYFSVRSNFSRNATTWRYGEVSEIWWSRNWNMNMSVCAWANGGLAQKICVLLLRVGCALRGQGGRIFIKRQGND